MLQLPLPLRLLSKLAIRRHRQMAFSVYDRR